MNSFGQCRLIRIAAGSSLRARGGRVLTVRAHAQKQQAIGRMSQTSRFLPATDCKAVHEIRTPLFDLNVRQHGGQ